MDVCEDDGVSVGVEIDLTEDVGVSTGGSSSHQIPQNVFDNLTENVENVLVSYVGMSSNSHQTPQKVVDKQLMPYVGMSFKSLDDARNYYKEYGRQEGFCVRTRTSGKKQWGVTAASNCLFVCSREGTHVKKEDLTSKTRNTSTVRCQCRAHMRVAKRKYEELYEVTMFGNEHSHNLVTPSKRMQMSVNRNLPEAAKNLIEAFSEEGLPVGKVPSVFGGDKIGFNAKDCHNHLGATRKKLKEGDATAALAYFQQKSAEDPQFYYAIQTDNKGRAMNFFWVHGRSRIQYNYFGDVVSFDTTYRTNVYKMPLAPFTGINHHLQSIQFGCALILDETEETFVWLFETWLKAMGGRPPTSMLTDQDRAMTAAVAKVFPTTRHRHCLWHIMMKFGEKLAQVYFKKSKFKKAIKKCIRETYRIGDFEVKWNEILPKYKVQDNQWLKERYEARNSWVPVYHLDTFYAGMNTTGRSESMNAFYDNFVSSTTTLSEFVYANQKSLETIAKKEREFDYDSEHRCRIVAKDAFLLQHAGKLYTKKVFNKFKIQWDKAKCDYKIVKEEIDNNGYNTYFLKSRNLDDQNEWMVKLTSTTMEGNCECKYFQFMGIPCGHILKVLIRHDVDEIPDHFILKRWMQRANTYRSVYDGGLVSGHENSEALRCAHSCKVATQLAYDASLFDETYTFVMEKFDELSVEISKRKEMLSQKGTTSDTVSSKVGENDSPDYSQVLLGNPNISQTKGRNKEDKASESVRRKSAMEIGQKKKGRKCNFCGQVNVDHDTRTCPKNPNRKKNGSSKANLVDETEDMDI